MAYLPYRPEEEPPQVAPPMLSREAATVQPGIPPQQTAPPPPPGSGKGTGFVDIRRYLEQNAPKTAGLAERIGGDVEGEAERVETGINEAGSLFDTTARERNLMDDQWVTSALADPTKTVSDEEALARFTALREGEYRGPTTMDRSPFLGDIGDVEMMGKNTLTSGGLEELMSGYSSDPSKGKTGLNTALLRQSAPAQERLAAARERTGALADYLDTAVAGSEATVADLQSQLGAYAPKVEGFTTGAAQTLQDLIDKEYAENLATGAKTLNDIIRERNLATYEAQTAPGADWEADVYRSFVPYVSEPGFSKSQSATADQFAREAALDQLLGRDTGVLANTEKGQAGTWEGAVQAMGASPELYDQSILYRIPAGWRGQDVDYSPGSRYDPSGGFRQTPDGKLQVREGGQWVTVGDVAEGTSGRDYPNVEGWGVRESDELWGTDWGTS